MDEAAKILCGLSVIARRATLAMLSRDLETAAAAAGLVPYCLAERVEQ